MPPTVSELIPEDHLVRVIDAIVEEINLDDLYNSYEEEGQPAYHPKMLIKTLLYGYGIGIRSSRKIAEKNRRDIYFMYLSGNQKPDFRTISDFRLNKRKYIEGCFNEVLSICKEMNIFSLGHVSIDGSKIKSNASKKKTKDREELLGSESKVKEILDEAEETDKQEDEELGKDKNGYELPEELSSKEKLIEKIKEAKKKLEENKKLKRINLTDTDSRFMKKSDGGIDECYNSQLAVDSDRQIITAYDVTNIGTDNRLFKSIYEQIIENTKEKPIEVSADAGYYSGSTYKYIEEKKIDAYVPESRFEKESKTKRSKFDRRNFICDKDKNEYICPGKERLVFSKTSSRNGIKFNIYEGIKCGGCQYKTECISKPSAPNRTIQIYENDSFKEKMREKLLSGEGRRKYNIRLKTVEPVFAQIKYIMGFNRFLLRGLDKVRVELSFACTAYNIRKISTLQMA